MPPCRSIYLWSVALLLAALLHFGLACGLASHSWAKLDSPFPSMDLVFVQEQPVEPPPQRVARDEPRPAPAPARSAPRETPPPPPLVTEAPVAPPPPEVIKRPEPLADSPAPRAASVDPPPTATPPAPSLTTEQQPGTAGRTGHVAGEARSSDAGELTAGSPRAGAGGPPAVASLPRGDAGSAAGSGPSTGTSTRGITQWARPQGGYQVYPSYPATARRLGIQGTTRLRVQVLADGHVGEIVVEVSAGHPDLDRAAADAVRQWHFEPARKGTEPVVSWVLLPVQFELKR